MMLKNLISLFLLLIFGEKQSYQIEWLAYAEYISKVNKYLGVEYTILMFDRMEK